SVGLHPALRRLEDASRDRKWKACHAVCAEAELIIASINLEIKNAAHFGVSVKQTVLRTEKAVIQLLWLHIGEEIAMKTHNVGKVMLQDQTLVGGEFPLQGRV